MVVLLLSPTPKAQEGGGVRSFSGFPAEYPGGCSVLVDPEVPFSVNVGLSSKRNKKVFYDCCFKEVTRNQKHVTITGLSKIK